MLNIEPIKVIPVEPRCTAFTEIAKIEGGARDGTYLSRFSWRLAPFESPCEPLSPKKRLLIGGHSIVLYFPPSGKRKWKNRRIQLKSHCVPFSETICCFAAFRCRCRDKRTIARDDRAASIINSPLLRQPIKRTAVPLRCTKH